MPNPEDFLPPRSSQQATSNQELLEFKQDVAEAMNEIVLRLQAVESRVVDALSKTQASLAVDCLKLSPHAVSQDLWLAAEAVLLGALDGRRTPPEEEAPEDGSGAVPDPERAEAGAVRPAVAQEAPSPRASNAAPGSDDGSANREDHEC